ncbi:MAG: lysylphosphatidylglycerol synthase transmembrane domain-containing protein [Chloroflexota bacterium]|nr:lysylphosphatidylglycerol synthase transmembrane domain-containing protein [Chloroflexota bacterium]
MKVNGGRRWLALVLSLMVSGGLLWFALRDLHLEEVTGVLRGANYWWLVPGVAVYFISVWFRAWRWGFLLRGSKRVSTAEKHLFGKTENPARAVSRKMKNVTGVLGANQLFPVVVIGYMGNDILPFRLGEVLRAYVLWRKEGINIGATFTTAVLERLFDGLTMVLFVLFGLLFIPLSDFLSRLVVVASVAFFGALLTFLFLAARPDLLQRVAYFFIERLSPARLHPPLMELVEGIVAGLESLRSGRDVLVLFGVTLWVWILETAKYWLVSFAFPDLHLPYVGILLMGGAVNLLTALPSLPGYIGTFELGIKILEGIGAPSAPAGSYILVLHAILLLPVTLLGLVFMAREGVQWAEVSKLQVASRKSQVADQARPRK